MIIPGTLASIIGAGLLLGCAAETKNKAGKSSYEIPKAGYPISVEDSGNEKVDALVRRLVSKRPAPFRSGSGPITSGTYSTPEVQEAIKSLKEMGPPIFPALVKHLGDDRYSYSEVPAGWSNFDVGSAVIEVLDDGHYTHSGYKYRKNPSDSYGGYVSFKDYLRARGAEEWAEWAKSKSRLEIQIDFIDWCISKENERGFTDDVQKAKVLQNYERARQRVTKEYSEPNDAAIKRR